MDIFTETEGLSGENLGSTILQYLRFNSQEIREAVTLYLSNMSPIGPVEYTAHFSCQTEYQTTSEEFGDGRLDILIQMDDVIIGIENKFYAQFQENQPIKYLEALKQASESLSQINRREVRYILFILCPQSRKKDATEKIKGVENAGIITWEEMLQLLKNVGEVANPIISALNYEFIKYLERQFSFIHDYKRKFVHYKNKFPDYGTPLQTELVGRIWSYMPSAGARLSNGGSWLGYYFYSDSSIEHKGWYGFVPRREIQERTDNEAELIIASTYKPKLSQDFQKVKMTNDNFISAPGETNAWIINFNEDWNNVEIWTRSLAPFYEPIKGD